MNTTVLPRITLPYLNRGRGVEMTIVSVPETSVAHVQALRIYVMRLRESGFDVCNLLTKMKQCKLSAGPLVRCIGLCCASAAVCPADPFTNAFRVLRVAFIFPGQPAAAM